MHEYANQVIMFNFLFSFYPEMVDGLKSDTQGQGVNRMCKRCLSDKKFQVIPAMWRNSGKSGPCGVGNVSVHATAEIGA